jgi:very-short-patch-repair endonuclease
MMTTVQHAEPYPSPLWGGVAPQAPGWGTMPHTAITKRTRGQARTLRRSPTDAERKMWFLLRSLKPLGIHFRRQAPVGIYIADFAWHAGKIVVELDGSQHAETRKAYDAKRTEWLQSQGYRVLRFWNNDVLKAPRSVGEAILTAAREIAADPTPSPSPQGGGERAAASGEDMS